MTVALRVALARGGDAGLGALTTVVSAFVVVAAFAALGGTTIDGRDALLFALAGALAPGASQLLFTLAVREAGASRASVVTGAAPLFAVVVAFVVLDEPFSLPLALGALLVVAGGVLLVLERGRPAHFRLLGLAFGAAGALLFAIRDNYVRAVSDDVRLDATSAAAIALLAGAAVIAVYVLVSRRGRLRRPGTAPQFIPAGVLFGFSYVALFEAYYRGRVSVVSPLVATESLWGVLLSALLLRHTETIGGRLAAGAALIVAGGALIGTFR
jgi:drug/metabolite transporter (DMT)-like permease